VAPHRVPTGSGREDERSAKVLPILLDSLPTRSHERCARRAADGFLPLHDAAGSDDAPLDVVYTLARLSPEAIGGHRVAAAAD
jgi:hypothetical protein